MTFTALLLERRKCVPSRFAALAFATTIGLLLACAPLFSQSAQGTIQGNVIDQTGGAVAGATVTIIDPARGLTRTLMTDSAGQYVAPNMTPGAYTVRGGANGFQTVEHQNVVVEVGETIRVDLTLQPGAQTQTVTVTSEAPQVDTSDAVLGGAISNDLFTNLPVNGRNFWKLLGLTPGASQYIGGAAGGGTVNAVSYNGIRPNANLYVIEGVGQYDPTTGGSIIDLTTGPGDAASVLSMDAIQEYNIEANPKAEFGLMPGAVIDVGIKSGTNSFHGDGFALGRDDAWDAPNYFSGLNQLQVENFGATLGGPILKDKLFFFVNFEALRDSVESAATPSMPSDIALSAAQDPSNELSMVNACNAVGRGNVNPLSAQLAGLVSGSCVPMPSTSTFENVFPFNPTTNLAIDPDLTNTESINGGLFKIDYQANAKSHFNGAYYISRQAQTSFMADDTEPQWATNYPTSVWMATGSWVYVPNSSWVNELRSGAALLQTNRAAADANRYAAAAWPSGYGINTGVTNALYGGFPTITISGFNGQLGSDMKGSIRGPEGDIDILDHVSYVRGNHSFMFGLDWTDVIADTNTYTDGEGSIAFSSLQNFLLGTPKSAKIFQGDATLDLRNQAYGTFLQDDWRVKPRLTLNLGLRWEYYTPITEIHNYMGNFYPNANPATTPAVQQAGGPFPEYYKPDWTQFSPRFGLAWDIRGNGRTVLRGGAGVLYFMPPSRDVSQGGIPFGANFPSLGIDTTRTALNLHTPATFSLTTAQLNWSQTGPVFPTTAPTVVNGVTYTGITCTVASPCQTTAINPDFRTPYTPEWHVDVERAITRSLSVDVAYVGNHGFKELSSTDINQAPFGYGWTNPSSALGGASPAAYCIASAPAYTNCSLSSTSTVMKAVAANEVAGETYPEYPYLSYINQVQNGFYSNYNGLEVKLSESGYHGLTFIAGYTLSVTRDFATSTGEPSNSFENSYNLKPLYGLSDLDLPNRFTFSTGYAIPRIKTPLPQLQLLEGWQINAIVDLQTGFPWGAADTTSDLSGTGTYLDGGSQFWNYSGPASAFQARPEDIPCFGKLAGCTPYVVSGGVPVLPAACATAAVAPYGNAELQSLALAALTNLGCYVQGSGVLTPPAFGTVGNAGRNFFRTQPFYNVDLSVFKNFKLKENISAQFRAEFYNLFNRADFAVPATVNPESGLGFGCACATLDAAGQNNSVLGSGGPRSMQIGLKLSF
jgi:hypothetical protein